MNFEIATWVTWAAVIVFGPLLTMGMLLLLTPIAPLLFFAVLFGPLLWLVYAMFGPAGLLAVIPFYAWYFWRES